MQLNAEAGVDDVSSQQRCEKINARNQKFYSGGFARRYIMLCTLLYNYVLSCAYLIHSTSYFLGMN